MKTRRKEGIRGRKNNENNKNDVKGRKIKDETLGKQDERKE